jgi:hypothetical protein
MEEQAVQEKEASAASAPAVDLLAWAKKRSSELRAGARETEGLLLRHFGALELLKEVLAVLERKPSETPLPQEEVAG